MKYREVVYDKGPTPQEVFSFKKMIEPIKRSTLKVAGAIMLTVFLIGSALFLKYHQKK